MSDEQQPDLRWAPIEPKPRNRGRLWLILGLVIAAFAIVGMLLFFLLPRGVTPEPGASATPSASAPPTSIPSSTAEPEPSLTPVTTPPAVIDPSIDTFRGEVQPYLDDALTGLDLLSTSGGDDAPAVVESLQADAQRLSERVSPSSVSSDWGDALSAYAQRLTELRNAVDRGDSVGAAIDAARTSVTNLRAVIGL